MTAWTAAPLSFRRRISLALAALATLAALQGGFAVWAVGQAEHHVARGRVAADIKQAFTFLWFDKQQLRNWMAQRQFGAAASDDQRDALLGRMRAALDRLDDLAAQAHALDDGAAARARQAERADALRVLRGSLDQLGRGLSSLNQPAPGLDTTTAWRIANDLFDAAEGRDLRALLADSLAREDVALREKRADSDATLAWLRRLWIGTTGAFLLAAFLLAAAFGRALRMPLRALAEGVAALRDGRLSHRIPLTSPDEFGAVARSMNAMAEELTDHRARETQTRQALEEQVERRTADLKAALDAQTEAEARRRQLFADISHELRTPTTAIRGEAQIALRGGLKPADEYRSSLTRIEDATRQLSTTIDDLLTMARSDIDSLSLRRADVDLALVLDEVGPLGAAMAEVRGLRFTPTPWPRPLPLRGDAARLRQMFLVLIDNAVRYSRPGGTITLAARLLEDGDPGVEVSIADEGIGIAAEDLARVFERGYRAPAAREHCADGSGLGLPIARVLAHAHGGDIDLRPAAGQGITAVAVLPLARAAGETP